MSTLDTDTPRRLRTADLIRWFDQMTERHAGEPSASVEITRNAKGEVQFSVKVYASASASEEDVERVTGVARNQAEEAFESLASEHPFGG